MPGKVADASVLGAVVFGEPRATETRLLLAGADLYEPALLAYELASIARKKYPGIPSRKGHYCSFCRGPSIWRFTGPTFYTQPC